MDTSHRKNNKLSAVTLNKQGIIQAVDLSGPAFGEQFGWPADSIVGEPFVRLHEGHNISTQEMLSGVRLVCQGKTQRYCCRFGLASKSNDSDIGSLSTHDAMSSDINNPMRNATYELIADHPREDSESVVVTYQELDATDELSQSVVENLSQPSLTALYEAMFQQASIGLVYQSHKGVIEHINTLGKQIFDTVHSRCVGKTLQMLPIRLLNEEGGDLPWRECPPEIALKTQQAIRDNVLGVKKSSGEIVWLKVCSETIKDPVRGDEVPQGVLTSFIDITREREEKIEQQAETERARMAIESSEMGVWDWIPEEEKVIWDKKLFELYGYDEAHAIDPIEAWQKAIHPEDVELLKSETRDMIKNKQNKNIKYRVLLPNGTVRHMSSRAHVIKNDHGGLKRIVGVTHDITNNVIAEKQLEELAYKDPLTRCSSRAGLNYRLSRTVARALKSHTKFVVLTLGLRRFKEVNENYGLSTGDKVLIEIARRAQSLMGINDTLARVAGDEFTLVLESVDVNELDAFVAKLQRDVLNPIHLNEGLIISLEAAIGTSMFPDDGYDAATLQNHAGLAMHNHRITEDFNFMRYSGDMSDEVSRKFNLKYQLLSAVKDEEFQLYYQPIIDLDSHKVIGCEALIRWKDNSGKFVSPMEFIPVVEESGLICELGRWINLTAVKQWKLWQQLVPELEYISVNVSPRQLEQEGFLKELISVVESHNVHPANIQLEITEGTFLKESLNADSTLHKLADYGFRLAIDDFGTGYSSLAYLKRFNVDVIKIDRSFIIDIESDESDRNIVSAILAMNKKLGFKTLVEGVETGGQDEIVQQLGCESAQGYLYGRPTFADEFAEVYIQYNPIERHA